MKNIVLLLQFLTKICETIYEIYNFFKLVTYSNTLLMWDFLNYENHK